MAAPFDTDALEVKGSPVPVVPGVLVSRANTGAADFSVSETGSLVYAEDGREARTLVWVDREGREETLAAEPNGYFAPRISPDGSRVALSLGTDVWIWDFARETLTRFTFDPQQDSVQLWTRDGRQIVFHSHRDGPGNVFVKSARGTGEVARLTRSAFHHLPLSLSPDDQWLLIQERDAANLLDLSLVSFPDGGDARPLLHSEFNEEDGAFAPNGRFLAYTSNESGRYEVYVRPFPSIEDGSWQISRGGGREPHWAPDGRELFFVAADGKLMGVPVEIGGDFTSGNPEVVIARPYLEGYDISPDGRRFLRIKESGTAAGELVIVLNWVEELKRLAPTGN